MKPRALTVVRLGAGLALAALIAACVSSPRPPVKSAVLTIAGQTPQAILGAGEMARIGAQVPAAYRADAAQAEAFGKIIFDYNDLARQAGKLIAPEGRSPFSFPAAGWLTEPGSQGLHVSFIVKDQNRIGIAAEVTRGASGLETQRLSPPAALTTLQMALWKARQAAYTNKFEACSQHYNPVVMPVSVEGVAFIYVFLLPVSADQGKLFLGGYHRIVASPDGGVVLEAHAYTHGCITLVRKHGDTAARVTEVVSDSPTAPQVYASLRYHLTIQVKTVGNGLTWQVANGRISLLPGTQRD